jgi:hypothetical protein
MQALRTFTRRTSRPAFGLLVLRDEVSFGDHLDRLRLAAVPTWSASTGFELLWLLEHMGARPSVALVDLRPVTHDRAARITDLASLAAATRLPTMLVGADEDEARLFTEVVAVLPADADVDGIVDCVTQHL